MLKKKFVEDDFDDDFEEEDEFDDLASDEGSKIVWMVHHAWIEHLINFENSL